jgi:cytochrome c oxidase subunit 1
VAVRTETYRADWRRGRVASWVTTVDHKRIGVLYIGTSLVFFAAGGLLALLMRAQLAQADETFITRHSYNELFTIHGTTMIFLFIVPFWAGLANFLVPLMIGARDMAFPRLNALSYWLFVFGGVTLFRVTARTSGSCRCISSGSRRCSVRSTSSARSTTCARLA